MAYDFSIDGTDPGLGAFAGWATPDDLGSIYSGSYDNATAVGINTDGSQAPVLPGDVIDQAQMGAWTPPAAKQQGAPWWAGLVAYGATRAIDNALPSPYGMYGNIYPGSIAGTNGRTYTLNPLARGGNVAQARVGVQANSMGLLLMAGVAILLLAK